MKKKLYILFFVICQVEGMEIELVDFANAGFRHIGWDKSTLNAREQLSTCIVRGDLKMMENIINNHQSVLFVYKKYFDECYMSPLCEAIIEHNNNCVNKLLELGANPNITDNKNLSIFCYLDPQKGLLAKKLIDHGADVNHRDYKGKTALMRMVSWCNLRVNRKSVFFCLLKNGADVNVQDDEGNSVSHMAITSKNRQKILPILLEYGANLSLPNKKLIRPIDLLTHINRPY